ncbi:hypothetical protein C1646_675425 [Rhizophagus diaphanus]|nr:hypothetical protein C1646_675425 [Rhizophagus diaphanus] [Rhizophagus sp. MUCL 43196]
MSLLYEIFKKKRERKIYAATKTNKKFSKKYLKKNKCTKCKINQINKDKNKSQKSLAVPKIYSKDDLTIPIPSQRNIKARSRSHSISYNLRPTSNSIVTPDEKTFRKVKNINIKVNIFWGEEYKKQQINLSIPRTSSFNLLKMDLSEKLGYKMPHDFTILYHTKKYHKNNTMKSVLLDYWIINKMLWCIDNDFMFRKHMLLWRDNIEITVTKKSLIVNEFNKNK